MIRRFKFEYRVYQHVLNTLIIGMPVRNIPNITVGAHRDNAPMGYLFE